MAEGDWICVACQHVGPPVRDKPFQVGGREVLAMVCSRCDSEDIFPYGTPEEMAEHEEVCAQDAELKAQAASRGWWEDDY